MTRFPDHTLVSRRYLPARRRAPLTRLTGSLVAVIALVVALLSSLRVAHADEETLERIEKLSKKAMESFDLLDYEAAKKLLNGAVAKAKTSGLEQEPIVAKVYLNLGIVYFSGEGDTDSARVAFIDAVRIDPNIEIDPGYKTDDMQALLDEVKAQFGDTGTDSGSVDCSAVDGLDHTLIDTTTSGSDLAVQALVAESLGAAKIALYYRFHGVAGASAEFTELDMASDGDCVYKATIPGGEISEGVIHYYIAAFDDSDKEVGNKGSERTPNLIEIEAAGDGSDSDNPFGNNNKKKKKKKNDDGTAKPATVFLSIALGTGGGYVTGNTEQLEAPVNCCFAPALLHVFPEIGYYLNPSTSISLAFRMGFPIGANRDMHATAAPSAMLRLRKSLSDTGLGLFWSGAIGGGVIRQTVTLTDVPDPTMNVDTTAIGPLFIGGSFGYSGTMSGPLRYVAELNLIAGIPVVSELGTARLNFGIQFDVNVGLVIGF